MRIDRKWVATNLMRYGLMTLVAITISINRLTTTLVGTLAVCVFVYILLPHITTIEPWGPYQVISWCAQQSAEALVAVAAIIAAYAVAIGTWRQQKAFELKLAAANELSSFVHDLCDDLIALEIYANNLHSFHRELLNNPDWNQFIFNANFYHSQLEEMAQRIDRTRTAAGAIYSLRPRHGVIFEITAIASWSFDQVQDAIKEVNSSLYRLPLGAENSGHFMELVARIDDVSLSKFEEVSDAARMKMLKGSGAVLGSFQARAISPGFFGIMRFHKTSRSVFGLPDDE